MAAKKQTFIDIELAWAESQLATWKAYVDKNPIDELEDRKDWKELKDGRMMPVVIASIEQQIKSIQDTMKNYLSLLAQVDAMRKQEETKKISVRGDQELSPMESGEI